MNKTKKIVTAVVSTVMAGTMIASFTACQPDGPSGPGGDIGSGKDLYGILNEDGTINYDSYKRDSEVTLNLAVGHEGDKNSTSFKILGDQVTLPDGKQYNDGNFKPAWVTMGDELNITWADKWEGYKTSDNLEKLQDTDTTGNKKYASVDMFTSDLSKITSQVTKGVSVLNLADYLDYMPHFKAFLEKNPVVYLSLLQEGMNTTTGKGQTVYVAPYFDGYNDIERYCLVRQDWVEQLLNGTAALEKDGKTLERTHAVEAYMGNKNYSIESLSEDGQSVIIITKNYSEVLKQIKTAGTALKAAYDAIDPAGYTGDSGNIIDIQNAAIEKGVTGKQLVTLFRAYIDVCYEGHYTAEKRSNLFNGYDAAWDVDDMVAMLRCVVNNAENLGVGSGHLVAGISPRRGEKDRTADLLRLAGQFYGVRGTASTLEYTYIDSKGELHDARADKEFYEALVNMNKLFQEGLIADYETVVKYKADGAVASAGTKPANAVYECFMEYDYSQTQTINDFYAGQAVGNTTGVPKTFNFAAIMNPVSRWDVDGNADNGHEVTMRFTESWRSTKTSGLGLNGALANKGNEDKLKAALQFVDYLYSNDGQIISTFGPMADADGNGGFWYGKEATSQEVSDGKYFTYKGVKYSGYEYKGKTTPQATQNFLDSFYGKKVNGWSVTEHKGDIKGAQYSYTNYARYLIGATLPVGVKNQSLENQLTAPKGEVGASRVGQALAKGTLIGMSLEVNSDNYWYTCVPTGLPVAADNQKQILDETNYQPAFKALYGSTGTKTIQTVMSWMILKGDNCTGDKKFNDNGVEYEFASIDALLNGKLSTDENAPSVKKLAENRQYAYNEAWQLAITYWDYIKDNIGK